jgi:hypothetical protein
MEIEALLRENKASILKQQEKDSETNTKSSAKASMSSPNQKS